MTRRMLITLAALLTLAAAAAPAGAAVLPADSTAVMSGAPDLFTVLPWPNAFAESTGHAVDDHAGKVAFASGSDGLLAGDDDDVTNVYVKDIATGAVTLASVGVDGAPSHVNCDRAVLSSNGDAVAFVCDGPLDAADTNGVRDVYLRDLVNRRTVLVSREPGNGPVGARQSFDASISGDGSFVAFASDAANLGASADGVRRVLRAQIGAPGVVDLKLISVTNGNNLPNTVDAAHPTATPSSTSTCATSTRPRRSSRACPQPAAATTASRRGPSSAATAARSRSRAQPG
jgi:Tol biopolymer transport system component